MNKAFRTALAGNPVIHLSPAQEVDGIWCWAIYANPRDFPGQYVVRQHGHYQGCAMAAVDALYVGTDLDIARSLMPGGSVCIGRFDNDDPAILEVWM